MNKTSSIKDTAARDAIDAPASISPMKFALGRLEGAMDDNMETIEVLRDKLSPVLATWISEEEESIDADSVSSNSELVNTLNNFIGRLENRTASIREIINRLDT